MLLDDVSVYISVHQMTIVLYCISLKTTVVVTMSLEIGKKQYNIIISQRLAEYSVCVCVCVTSLWGTFSCHGPNLRRHFFLR